MIKRFVLGALLFFSVLGTAYAQNEFPSPTAGKPVPGVVVMCLNASNQAVPTNQSNNCPGGGGGGGGAITIAAGAVASGAYLAGSLADGAIVALGTTTDAACAGDATSGCTSLSRLSRIAARLTTLIGNLPAALGQTTSAASLPVVLPSDPDTRPASGNITIQDTGSATTTGQNSATIITGTPTAASFQTQAINGQSGGRILVSGTWTGTLEFDGSVDSGTTWTPIPTRVVGSSFTAGTITGNGQFDTDVSGLTNIRVRATAAMTGTAAVRFTFTTTTGPVQILNPVRLFDNTSGAQGTIKPASTPAAQTDTGLVERNPDIGTPGDTACATDTGSCTVNALLQRLAQRLTTAIAGTSPAATENHIGEVGGNILPITNAMTTSNNTVTTGKSVGGLQTIANAVRVSGSLGASGTSGMIQSVMLTFKDAIGSVPFDVYFFNANPTGSTCTDNTTFALVDADRDKTIAVTHVTDITASNTAAIAQAMNQATPFGVASATSIFACVVSRGSAAITGVANASLITRILRN